MLRPVENWERKLSPSTTLLHDTSDALSPAYCWLLTSAHSQERLLLKEKLALQALGDLMHLEGIFRIQTSILAPLHTPLKRTVRPNNGTLWW